MADDGDPSDPWLSLDPASYQVQGDSELKFMVLVKQEDGSNRIPRRKRPYRPGWKLDCTGPNGDEIQVEAVFHNDLTEPKIGDTPRMWPDRLDRLIKAFKTGKTGTLHLPWRRNIKAKPEKWSRKATAGEMRGGEMLSVTFVEDNEDSLDQQAAQGVSVAASVSHAVKNAVFDLERSGMFDGSFEQFTELASELEGTLAAPGEFLQDIQHKATRVQRAAQSILDSFSTRLQGRDGLLGPEGIAALLALKNIIDTVGGVLGESSSRGGGRRTVGRTFDRPRDLFDIAAELGQDGRALLAVNTGLEDPSYIPAGTVVLVFAG